MPQSDNSIAVINDDDDDDDDDISRHNTVIPRLTSDPANEFFS